MIQDAVAVRETAPRPRSRSRSWAIQRMLRHSLLVVGGGMCLAALLVALGAAWVAPYDPQALNPSLRLQNPSLAHLWGTDQLGRDIFSRVVWGTRLSLLIGAAVSVASAILGTVIGLAAGYFRRLDEPLMRLMDGLMAFPSVLLAIIIMAAVGARVENVIAALTIVMVPRLARTVRASALVVRELLYVEAARATGAGHLHIILRHILPNCLPPLIVQTSYTFALAILSEASLSFIGVGVPPEIPSLGGILADSRLYMRSSPWMPMLPGLSIMWLILGLNQLGDALRDVLDPSMHRS